MRALPETCVGDVCVGELIGRFSRHAEPAVGSAPRAAVALFTEVPWLIRTHVHLGSWDLSPFGVPRRPDAGLPVAQAVCNCETVVQRADRCRASGPDMDWDPTKKAPDGTL
mgnify:CR=1 FL=1